MSEVQLYGLAAAPGVAVAPVLVYRPAAEGGDRVALAPDAERERLSTALGVAAQQLDVLAVKTVGEAAAIVTAHRLMLDDPELRARAEELVAAGSSAEAAVSSATDEFATLLESLDDPYLRERGADIRDVGRRVLAVLAGKTVGLTLTEPCIVVAADLAPTDTIAVDRRLLLGIVTEQGGVTSHTCILARSWGIPAVVGASGVLSAAQTGMTAALDGAGGLVVLDPEAGEAEAWQARMAAERVRTVADLAEAALPAVTPDGRQIELAANVGNPEDVALAMERGAEGIGLLRSEFLFMGRAGAPDEETQYQAYSQALRNAGGKRVIIRTLDIGGDKAVPYLDLPEEENPFLGCRALRLCLARPQLFQTQLRALLRAGIHGHLAIMFPMVASVDDLEQALAALTEAKDSLQAEGIPHLESPEIGIMIEIPSAALIAGHLAEQVDFFSIGTNDLVQYTLAVDRGNPRVAAHCQPLHPAVLQLISQVCEAAHRAGKWVGVCGEMAGTEAGALLLTGLGVDELSMAAPTLPTIRRLLRSVPYSALEALAGRAVQCRTHAEVMALIGEHHRTR